MRAPTLTLLVFTVAAVALAALAYGPLRGDTFSTIDSAIKFLQASSLLSSGFRSTALLYPAAVLDPGYVFVPFDPPFVFRNATGYESIFPSAYAIVIAPMVRLGPAMLRVLSILGGAATVAATASLAERGPRWMPALLVAFATPLWFYATATGEVTLALAASTAAFVLARRDAAGADVVCGLLVGAAAILRDESLLLVPGLLYARYRYARSSVRFIPLLMGVALPIILMAVIDDLWLKRPILAHLRHALPMVNQLLPRSHAILPELPALTWPDRYFTIVHYWLLGGGTPYIAASLLAAILLAAALRRHLTGPIVVAAVLLVAVTFQWRDIVPLLGSPRFMAGLLRLSPFLLFALLPSAPGQTEGPGRAVALVTFVAFLALSWISLNTAAGKGLGPRLTIALWPLLVAAAWDVFRSWGRWPGSRWIKVPIVGAGAILIAGSLAMEMLVALPAWTFRVRADEDALIAIRAAPGDVVVLNDDVDMQLVAADFFRRPMMLVTHPRLWRPLAAQLAASGESEFLVVSRTPDAPSEMPPFRLAGEQLVSRYHLQHFIR